MKAILKAAIYFLLSPFIIKRGKKGAIYITFDDGPHPVNTPIILKILNELGIKATFFMVGQQMEANPELVREILSHSHSVGYHSYSHESARESKFREFKSDFKKIEEIENNINTKIKLYRPPYGDITVASFLWLIVNHRKTVMWSLDSRDSYDRPDQILETLHPDKIKDGEIILFHDDYSKTVDLLPQILERLINHGRSFAVL